jgi:hypothetical protein
MQHRSFKINGFFCKVESGLIPDKLLATSRSGWDVSIQD